MEIGRYLCTVSVPPFFVEGDVYVLLHSLAKEEYYFDGDSAFNSPHYATESFLKAHFSFVDDVVSTSTVKVVDVDLGYKSSTDGGGKRYNEGKPRVELLVPEAMAEEARVWEFGAKKYDDYNWARGMAWTKVLGCILRHTFAIMRGEDVDKESGCLHAAHIRCNAAMLIFYYYYYKQGDDRFPRPEKKDE